MRRPSSHWIALLATGVLAIGLTGCGEDPGPGPETLTVWNLDAQPDRMAALEEINEDFTDRTGVQVELVAVQENQLPSLIVSAAVSDSMPDVVNGLPLAYVQQLHQQGLLNTETAAEVVDSLGPETFSDRALALTREDGTQLAVPSSAWAQILVYRKDLFEQKGLPVPDTYTAIAEAAAAFGDEDMAGISLATDPGDPFTHQTFEFLALGNDCRLVDEQGRVQLDSPACREAFSLYGDLARNHSPAGAQSVDSTRATYFAGQAAMTVWSTFLLDELGGLRDDALPTCEQCRDDTEWLARNTGVVTTVQGPDGAEPVGYGEIATWTVLAGAHPRTGDYVEHMMDEGYEETLAVAPEGKYPTRLGTPQDPDRFVAAWRDLEAGVDTQKPLSAIYGDEVLDDLEEAVANMRRWAVPQGHGALLGPVVAELVLPRQLSALANGQPPEETAENAADAVREIQRSQQ